MVKMMFCQVHEVIEYHRNFRFYQDEGDVAEGYLSQPLTGLIPGNTYTLTYHYLGSSFELVIVVSIGGVQVDYLESLAPVTSFQTRTATYVATSDSATLEFDVDNKTPFSRVTLDLVELVTTVTSCSSGDVTRAGGITNR